MPVPMNLERSSTAPPPSILNKMGMGAAMGGAVGLTLGFLFGSFSIISRGPGPRGPLNTLATYMASSGGTFAFFMSIGSVIRTETEGSYPHSSRPLSISNNWPPHWHPQSLAQLSSSAAAHHESSSRARLDHHSRFNPTPRSTTSSLDTHQA